MVASSTVVNPAELSGARLSTSSGIRYKLLKQRVSATMFDATAEEVYLIRSRDVADFLLESFPLPTWIGLYVFPSFPRQLPGNPYMLTKSVAVESLDDELPVDIWRIDTDAPSGTYNDTVQVTIQYESMPNESDFNPTDPSTWLKHSVQTGGEFLMLPAKNAEWEDSGDVKDFNAPISKVIPTIEHSLDWSYALFPPWTTIRRLLGTVNDEAIPLFNNAPIETVLFMSLSGEQTWTTAGAKPWSLSYKFSERHIVETAEEIEGEDDDDTDVKGWNHVYNPSTNRFERLKRVEPGTSEKVNLYASSTFADLFKAEVQDPESA